MLAIFHHITSVVQHPFWNYQDSISDIQMHFLSGDMYSKIGICPCQFMQFSKLCIFLIMFQYTCFHKYISTVTKTMIRNGNAPKYPNKTLIMICMSRPIQGYSKFQDKRILLWHFLQNLIILKLCILLFDNNDVIISSNHQPWFYT